MVINVFVLTSHGDYAKAALASCELITGPLDNFSTVSFNDPMSVDDVVQQYQQIYDKNTQSEFIIIANITNGTPANAANIFKGTHPDVKIYAGLSLMLILALATGTPIDEAFKQSLAMSGLITNERKVPASSKENIDKTSTVDPLVNVRIDARLIHGQVATMWTRSVNATRIMIVDDQVVQSNVQKMTLKTAVPGGIHLSILTAKGAAERINAGKYAGQRVFLIVRNPQMLKIMQSAGVKFKNINVGNMSMSEGAKQIAKSVAVTPDDIETFNALSKSGIHLYHQMVPNDHQEDLMTLITEGK